MTKIKIEICKALNTKGHTLIINGKRLAGYKSGHGYFTLQSFEVDKKELINAL